MISPGDRFGKLTVLGAFDRTTRNGEAWVALQCECGTFTAAGPCNLRGGKRSACNHCEAERRRAEEDIYGPEADALMATPYALGLGNRLAAQDEYRAALRAGVLVVPEACSCCGATGRRIVGHHPDYRKPLDVEWLCNGCHAARHVELRSSRILAIWRERREREAA